MNGNINRFSYVFVNQILGFNLLQLLETAQNWPNNFWVWVKKKLPKKSISMKIGINTSFTYEFSHNKVNSNEREKIELVKKIGAESFHSHPSVPFSLSSVCVCFFQWRKTSFSRIIVFFFFNFSFTGSCFTTASKMAVWKWFYVHNVVSFGSHQFRQYRTREAIPVLVSQLMMWSKQAQARIQNAAKRSPWICTSNEQNNKTLRIRYLVGILGLLLQCTFACSHVTKRLR